MIFLDQLNDWIANHTPLLTLIGIPTISFMVTYFTNRFAEARDTKQRSTERFLASELKLVEFRQIWINDLRNELTQFTSKLGMADENFGEWEAAAGHVTKIQLLMNPNDPDYPELVELSTNLIRAMSDDEKLAADNANRIVRIAQRILKREWERLKEDLNRVASG